MKEATSKRRNVLSPSIRLIDVVSAWLTIQAALSCKVVEHAEIRLKPGHARRTCHRLSVCTSLLACVLSLFTSLHFAGERSTGRGPAPRRPLPRLGGGRGFGVSKGRSLSSSPRSLKHYP